MVKKINRAIIGKLNEKLKLSQGGQSVLLLDETVVPIFDIDSILGVTKTETDSTTATSLDSTFTVPTGKYWIIRNAWCQRDNSGTNTMYVQESGNTVVFYAAAGTNVGVNQLNIKLTAGQSFRILAGGGTSGNIYNYIIFEEFEVD